MTAWQRRIQNPEGWRESWLLLLAAVLLLLTATAEFSVSVTVDENGNGRLTNTDGFNAALPLALRNESGARGSPNILTYSLLNPPGLLAGDVLLRDGVGGPILDVVR